MPPSAGPVMVATCAAAARQIAVARCSEPRGAISGSSAAMVGLSNAPAVPSTNDRDKNMDLGEPAAIGAPGRETRRSGPRPTGRAAPRACVRSDRRRWPATNSNNAVGKELHQPDHAEIEGAAGQVIDLPADRHRADLAGRSASGFATAERTGMRDARSRRAGSAAA